jgi:hypothetical protein
MGCHIPSNSLHIITANQYSKLMGGSLTSTTSLHRLLSASGLSGSSGTRVSWQDTASATAGGTAVGAEVGAASQPEAYVRGASSSSAQARRFAHSDAGRPGAGWQGSSK